MNTLDAIVLGITQGLTEFIPVSSSGHLVILQNILGLGSEHLFLEFINIGTFLALLIYFRHKIIDILRDVFIHKNYNLARNIIITSIPAGLIGVLFASFINSFWLFNNLTVTLSAILVVGIIMIVLNKLPHASSTKNGASLTPLRALFIGSMQIFAFIPGVSRSGSTIIAGRLAGLKSETAAEYSFLASIPIMAGVTLKTILGDFDYLVANFEILLISNIFAFVAGLFAVGFMLNYLKKNSLAVFGWYRVLLATVFFAFLLIH